MIFPGFAVVRRTHIAHDLHRKTEHTHTHNGETYDVEERVRRGFFGGTAGWGLEVHTKRLHTPWDSLGGASPCKLNKSEHVWVRTPRQVTVYILFEWNYGSACGGAHVWVCVCVEGLESSQFIAHSCAGTLCGRVSTGFFCRLTLHMLRYSM